MRTDWALQASWKMYKRRLKMEIAIVVAVFALGIVCLGVLRYATI